MKVVSNTKPKIQTHEEIIDLRGKIPVHLKDGAHILHTAPDGTKLAAYVKNGKFLSWQGQAKDGTDLKTRIVRDQIRAKCEACVWVGIRKVCYWVDCQIIAD